MSEAIITVRNLSKSFGKLNVWQDLNVDIQAGEKIAIIGGSGCGKSVFLRSLELLVKPDSGRIVIDGDEITAKGADVDRIRRKMSMVYQNFNLFSHMNVMDNLCLAPVRILKMPRTQAEEKAMVLLKEVGLSTRAKAWPDNLSGGQKQRIAIARCLMMDPKIMLFDEPTSALDPTMVGEVLATIRSLSRKNMTMLVVTHEMSFAKSFSDRVLFLAEHCIYEQGTPEEIFENPRRELTQQFVYKVKRFDYQVRDKHYDLMHMAGQIYSFCERYGMASDVILRLQLCSEEIIEELLSQREGEADIRLIAEYSETDSQTRLNCRWKGEAFDLSQIDDNLRLKLICGTCKSYAQTVDGDYNAFTMVF